MHQLNYVAILVTGIAIFILGGLWYSPILFARPWVRLMGKSEDELKAGAVPILYLFAFVCGLLISWGMALALHHLGQAGALCGAHVGAICWIAFAAPTSFANAIFAQKPKMLWLIDSGYNLVSFVMAGVILGVWR